ncbi:MAG: hypothetical protein HYT11_00405, partial [Candidatus Levybacteria bacterium]|nr:hypothetical protein [Candidatus Levybacteria bacterium]
SSFLFLSVVRFVSDPDFVTDWIGYLLELQFGMAIIIGSVLERFIKKKNSWVFWAGIFVIVILLNCYIVSNLAIKQFSNIGNAYQQKIITILKENVPKGERVFLSGTPVFWINAYLDQAQIRGGNDSASVHPFWRHAAFQIREGKDPLVSRDLLFALGVPYVLVHKDDSEEVFRDFKVPAKFESRYFKNIAGENDMLYKVDKSELLSYSSSDPDEYRGSREVSRGNSSRLRSNNNEFFGIARIADERIMKVKKPRSGDDKEAIASYVSYIKRPANAAFLKPNVLTLKFSTDQGEVVSLAVAYHPSWRIVKGEGRIDKDAFGNIAITPEKSGEQQFVLSFSRKTLEIALPIFISLVFCFALLYHESISRFLSRVFSRRSFGLSENDD